MPRSTARLKPMKLKRHQKKQCIREMEAILLYLAKMHLMKTIKYMEPDDFFGLSISAVYRNDDGYPAKIVFSMSSDIRNTADLLSGDQIELRLALWPSLSRYYEWDANGFEMIDVDAHWRGIDRTIKSGFLCRAAKQRLRKRSLTDLRAMADNLAGLQSGIFLQEIARQTD
jgi:hypothetical protein